jgi:hypothetical protein
MIGTSSSKRNRRKPPPPLTCADLAEQGRWDLSLCCEECHADPELLIEDSVMEANPLEGRRHAMICCRAFWLLNDWHAGKQYDDLPEHE